MSSPSTGQEPNKRPRAAGRSRSAAPQDEPGVLSSLPSTRPQRPSARRAAARAGKAPPMPAEPPAPRTRRASAGAAPRGRAPKPAEPPAPPQGFEAEGEIEPGRSVQPPTGAELAGSLAELVGELAQAGLSSGGRLLKDALTRLSGG